MNTNKPTPETTLEAVAESISRTMIEAPKPEIISLFGATADAIAVPTGYNLTGIDQFREFPRHIKESLRLTTLGSFCDYVNRYKRIDDSLVMINPDLATINAATALATAFIDYHTPNSATRIAEQPRKASHQVAFHPTPSPAYALLCDMDGKLLEQDAFCLRLRDLTRFCTSHPGGELLEIIRTLSLTSRGEYQSHSDDVNGSVRLKYNLDVEATAGTQEKSLTVPSTISFAVPVFLDDTDATEIVTELCYRTPRQSGGKVQLGLRLPERLWLEHQRIEAVASKIREVTGLLVITGNR
jgi:hypothetical protein